MRRGSSNVRMRQRGTGLEGVPNVRSAIRTETHKDTMSSYLCGRHRRGRNRRSDGSDVQP